jgi:Beta-lactamase enzyme family
MKLIFLLLLGTTVVGQPKTDSFLLRLLEGSKDPLFSAVISHPDTYRLQVIYTQINRDSRNIPSFKHYYFHYDPKTYFNPASMVKLPLAILSLEKINSLRRHGVTKNSTILFDSSQPWQHPLCNDTTAASGLPSIAHFIKRALLISENDPYNRMYQFLGQGYINRALHQNRYTNAVRFFNAGDSLIYSQPQQVNADSFDFSQPVLLGKGYLDRNDSLIAGPFDFTQQNNLSLQTMQQLLQTVLFPLSVPEKKRFRLGRNDLDFLYRYLSQYPSETSDPKYDTATFYDSYVKFYFRDSTRRVPPYVRIFNKVGWSYGFLTDVSYVADFKHKVEFMLSATLYVNSDGILNDNKYEYDSIGHPFLFQLGQLMYNVELRRKRRFAPGLQRLTMTYTKRDPADTRPFLKEVDN